VTLGSVATRDGESMPWDTPHSRAATVAVHHDSELAVDARGRIADGAVKSGPLENSGVVVGELLQRRPEKSG
jgi:hypothetical protein